MSRETSVRTVRFESRQNAVVLIDQRRLPHEFQVVATTDYRETAEAIRDMTVRGAGAMGATAAYGLAQGARAFRGSDLGRFAGHLATVYRELAEARPTAVDPVNALDSVLAAMSVGTTVATQQALALDAAERFAEEDVAHCTAIGRHGLKFFPDGIRVLTHCNAGRLAFVDVGSATAPIYAAHAAGRRLHVFCDETRPRCQGASLTAWELSRAGVPHSIITDNAAGHLMQRGEIDVVIVGADRVLGRTGEVANKIGTYTKAVLAARHRIPFYVAIPLSTLDWNLRRGIEIPIEERSGDEVLGVWGVPAGKRRAEHVKIANPGSPARNPGFDVTPAELITGIITPVGVFRPEALWKQRHRLGGETAQTR